MSDPTSLFNSNAGGNPPPADGVSGDNSLADLLGSIKNERGEPKYKDVASALVGLKNAQEFIPTLQRSVQEKDAELAAARAAAERVAELEALVASLTNKPDDKPSPPPANNVPDIAAVVNQVLSANEQAKVAKTNSDLVVQEVTRVFGKDAEAKFYEKATEMGMSVGEFNSLAAKSPKAVLKMLGINEPAPKAPSFAPNTSSLNTTGFTPAAESMIGRNKKPVLVGATTQDVIAEVRNAKAMVAELEANGMSINDLTKPSVFFKHF